MSDHLITSLVSIAVALTGVAILALLVSKQANTSNVFGALGDSVSQAICVATSPVTGANCRSLVPNVNSTITF